MKATENRESTFNSVNNTEQKEINLANSNLLLQQANIESKVKEANKLHPVLDMADKAFDMVIEKPLQAAEFVMRKYGRVQALARIGFNVIGPLITLFGAMNSEKKEAIIKNLQVIKSYTNTGQIAYDDAISLDNAAKALEGMLKSELKDQDKIPVLYLKVVSALMGVPNSDAYLDISKSDVIPFFLYNLNTHHGRTSFKLKRDLTVYKEISFSITNHTQNFFYCSDATKNGEEYYTTHSEFYFKGITDMDDELQRRQGRLDLYRRKNDNKEENKSEDDSDISESSVSEVEKRNGFKIKRKKKTISNEEFALMNEVMAQQDLINMYSNQETDFGDGKVIKPKVLGLRIGDTVISIYNRIFGISFIEKMCNQNLKKYNNKLQDMFIDRLINIMSCCFKEDEKRNLKEVEKREENQTAKEEFIKKEGLKARDVSKSNIEDMSEMFADEEDKKQMEKYGLKYTEERKKEIKEEKQQSEKEILVKSVKGVFAGVLPSLIQDGCKDLIDDYIKEYQQDGEENDTITKKKINELLEPKIKNEMICGSNFNLKGKSNKVLALYSLILIDICEDFNDLFNGGMDKLEKIKIVDVVSDDDIGHFYKSDSSGPLIGYFTPGWLSTNAIPDIGHTFLQEGNFTKQYIPGTLVGKMATLLDTDQVSELSSLMRMNNNIKEGESTLLWARFYKGNDWTFNGSGLYIGLNIKLMKYGLLNTVNDVYSKSTYNAYQSTTSNNNGNFSVLGTNEFPYQGGSGAAVVLARIVTFRDFTEILFNNILPDVGWEAAKWGSSVHIVFVDQAWLSDPLFMTYWTIIHMSYPFLVPGFTGLNKTVVSNVPSASNTTSYSKATTCVNTSSAHNFSGSQRVLFVTTNMRKGAFQVSLNAGVIISTALNYVISGGVALDVPIDGSFRTLYNNVLVDIVKHMNYCDIVFQFWCNQYGDKDDMQVIRDILSEHMFHTNYSHATDNDVTIAQTRYFNLNCQNQSELSTEYKQAYPINAPYAFVSAKGQVEGWLSPTGMKTVKLLDGGLGKTYNTSIPQDSFLLRAGLSSKMITQELIDDFYWNASLFKEFPLLLDLAINKTACTDRLLQERNVPMIALMYGTGSSTFYTNFTSLNSQYMSSINDVAALMRLNNKTMQNMISRNAVITDRNNIDQWYAVDFSGKLTTTTGQVPEYMICRISAWYISKYLSKAELWSIDDNKVGEVYSTALSFDRNYITSTFFINSVANSEYSRYTLNFKQLTVAIKNPSDYGKKLLAKYALTDDINESNRYWIYLCHLLSTADMSTWQNMFARDNRIMGFYDTTDRYLANFYFHSFSDQEQIVSSRRYNINQAISTTLNSLDYVKIPNNPIIYSKYSFWNRNNFNIITNSIYQQNWFQRNSFGMYFNVKNIEDIFYLINSTHTSEVSVLDDLKESVGDSLYF